MVLFASSSSFEMDMVNKDLKRMIDIIADCEKIFADITCDDFENPASIDWMVNFRQEANDLDKIKAGISHAIVDSSTFKSENLSLTFATEFPSPFPSPLRGKGGGEGEISNIFD
jgi:hypothetical protein